MQSWQTYQNCKSAVGSGIHSMTSGTRLAHTFYTIKELDKQNIQGDIVECGVWKGGQPIRNWLVNTNTARNFWLYDTFGGMTQPNRCRLQNKQRWHNRLCKRQSQANGELHNGVELK